MIYMEPTTMGYTPLLDSYLQSLPDLFQPHVDKFREIFEAVVPGMEGIVFFMRKNLKETVTTVDTCLVKGQFNLMASLLKRYVRDPMKGEEPLSGEERRNADKAAVPLWIFSMIWSLCASVTGPGRPQLEQFFRKKAEEHEFANFMPPEGKGDASMYEYCYDQDKCTWVEWMQTIPEYKPNPDQAFASIIVPTADTVRYTYVIDKLLLNDKHVLCVGDTGTGKTLNVMDKLNNNMPDLYVPMFMTFSARTSANQTQDFLDSKMDKRRKGVFGPPMGKKYAILIDDFNMPMREKYFAQPPIELLRQWMDHGGWYERHPPCPFRTLQDTIIVGCMGPPGGGRNPVSNRMLRHLTSSASPTCPTSPPSESSTPFSTRTSRRSSTRTSPPSLCPYAKPPSTSTTRCEEICSRRLPSRTTRSTCEISPGCSRACSARTRAWSPRTGTSSTACGCTRTCGSSRTGW